MNLQTVPALLLSAVIFAACSTGGGFQSDKILTAENAGLVLLRNGDQFSVKLDANPTTGFEWSVLISNENMLIRQGKSVYTPSASEASAVGVGGTETFKYRIAGSGNTTLRFEYKRPFESGRPAKVVVFEVVVN